MEDLMEYKKMLENQIKPYQSSDFQLREDENILKTGFILYDEIIGGIPQITMISSLQGAGKTTLLVQLAQVLQKHPQNKQIVIYFDTEHSMSKERFKQLGLDLDKMVYIQSEALVLEDVYRIMHRILSKRLEEDELYGNTVKRPRLVFQLDSMTQTPTTEEIQSGVDTHAPALKQRLNSRQLPKILPLLIKTNSSFLIINQLRKNLNIGQSFFSNQDPEDTTGGLQLKYFQTVDLRLEQGSKKQVEEKFGFLGRIVYVKQIKNRLMTPFIEFPMQFDFQRGFTNIYSILLFLQGLKNEDWEKQGFSEPQFIPKHPAQLKVNLCNKLKYEKSFRIKKQFELYMTDMEFRRQINSLQITVIRRIFKNQKDQCFIEGIDREKVLIYEDFITYSPDSESEKVTAEDDIQNVQEESFNGEEKELEQE